MLACWQDQAQCDPSSSAYSVQLPNSRKPVSRARPGKPQNARGSVRIIGGTWRSRRVAFPDSAGLRPTPDRVRETLFNWLGQDLTGYQCLDLYSGSGVLAFEALSRGAVKVTMLERDAAVARALRASADQLGATDVEIRQVDALEFLRGKATSTFDLVFVDPPFATGMHAQTLQLLPPWLNAGGRVFLESDSSQELPPGWVVDKHGKAGSVYFQLLSRETS